MTYKICFLNIKHLINELKKKLRTFLKQNQNIETLEKFSFNY
jgi:hypothetical protein